MRFDKFTDFDEYIESNYNRVQLEEGTREIGPLIDCTVAPGRPPWKVTWYVMFEDGKYMRLDESYYTEKRARGGGGFRVNFSFHYGDTPVSSDADGVPEWRNNANVDLRIDSDRRGPHLHFQGEDHIPQDRVKGLDISSQKMFDFVGLILRHRREGTALQDLFGFEVEAAT